MDRRSHLSRHSGIVPQAGGWSHPEWPSSRPGTSLMRQQLFDVQIIKTHLCRLIGWTGDQYFGPAQHSTRQLRGSKASVYQSPDLSRTPAAAP